MLIRVSLLLLVGIEVGLPKLAHGQVAEAWVRRYGNLPGGDDRPTAIAADGDGNVFVTGYSKGIGYDFATIKYSPAGVALWTNRFDGNGGDDQAFDMAIDSDGNVIVTGDSRRSGMPVGYTTIKYQTDGVPAWTNFFVASAAGNGYPHVVIGENGNVFVTGTSYNIWRGYLTITYSPTGTPLWTNIFGLARAKAAAIGNGGSVFITGNEDLAVGGPGRYVTIAFTASGLSLWTNNYGSTFAVSAVAVSSNGNVIVTGYQGTLAYSGSGVPLWTNRTWGAAVAIAPSGNIYVAGSPPGGGSYSTIAYSSVGVALWTNYSQTANGSLQPSAIAVDNRGNIYVTGSSTGINRKQDIVTFKYSQTGELVWIGRYNGPANGDDTPLSTSSLTIGPDDAVYVIGASDGDYSTNTVNDDVTIKYVNTEAISPLQIRRMANEVELTWANEALRLQSAPTATGVFTNIPIAISPFVSPITGQQQFFRLKAN